MSFDPVTATWAASKAAEMVGESGGGSGSPGLKKIDLSTAIGGTINMLLIEAFVSGGGSYELPYDQISTNFPLFWQELSGDEPLEISFAGPPLKGSTFVTTQNVTRARTGDTNELWQLAFFCALDVDYVLYQVFVCISYDGRTVYVALTLETTAEPSIT